VLNPVLAIQIALAQGASTTTADLSTVASTASATPTSAPLAVPANFQIFARNSGTGADATPLMGQMEDEYFVGFGLQPYGDVPLTFQYDPVTGYIEAGLYLLYATTGNSPPVIRTGVAGYDFDPPGFPLVCQVSTVDLSLTCRANGQVFGRLMVVNGMSLIPLQNHRTDSDEVQWLTFTPVNNDGLLELAIGNGATAASTFVSTIELYLVDAGP
jgi:hypothetical protein